MREEIEKIIDENIVNVKVAQGAIYRVKMIDALVVLFEKYKAVQLGKLGGKVKSEAKTKTAQENGKKGGRPRHVKFKDDTTIVYKCGCSESRLESPEYWEKKCNMHAELV